MTRFFVRHPVTTWMLFTAFIVLGVYSVPRISQVHLFFRANLLSPNVAPGPESLEVGFFAWADVPWDKLAFPSVRMALEAWRATLDSDDFQPHRASG